MVKARKIIIFPLIIVMILANLYIQPPEQVYAGIDTGYSDFAPNQKNWKAIKDQSGFTDKVAASGNNSDDALIPANSTYSYLIYGSSTGSTSTKQVSHSVCAKFDSGNYDWSMCDKEDNWFIFNPKDVNSIVIDYPGLYVYNPDKEIFVKVNLKVEVVKYGYKKYFDAMSDPIIMISKKVYNQDGIPGVTLVNISTANIKYSFYDDSGAPVKINTNITFGDIDAKQSVSMNYSSFRGHTAWNGGSLLRGGWIYKDDGVTKDKYSFVGPEEGSSKYKANELKGGFYIEGTSFNIYYTSNQKTSDGKPNGLWSYFKPSTLKKHPVTIKISDPEKYVIDTDSLTSKHEFNTKSNDLQKNGTNDLLSNRYEAFDYYIIQQLPLGMYDGMDGQCFESFAISDKLDDCLDYLGCDIWICKRNDKVDAWHAKSPAGKDGYPGIGGSSKSDFTITDPSSSNNNTFTAKWKGKNESKLYGDGLGTYVIIKIRAMFNPDKNLRTEIGAHTSPLAGDKPHMTEDFITIPNRATTKYKLQKKSEITRNTNLVKTNVKTPDDGEITIYKQDENGNPITNNKAEFGLYLNGEFVISDWTDNTGKVHFKDLTFGTYQIKELTPPKGFIAASSIPNVTVSKGSDSDKKKSINVGNEPTTVSILKIDEQGNPLPGAKLQLYKDDGTPVGDPWISSTTPHVIKYVYIGDYYVLKELETPGNLYIKSEDMRFQIPKSGRAEVKMTDPDNKLDVKIRKVDFITGHRLGGVKLELYQGEFPGTTPITGPRIDAWTSKSDEDKEETLIPDTYYTVVEKEYPLGYGAPDGSGTTDTKGRTVFKTKSYGSQVETIIVENTPIPLHVYVEKIDASTNQRLAGATLELYNDNNERLARWVSTTDKYDISNLVERGKTYTIKEVEAPFRYHATADKTFTVTNDTTQNITVENLPTGPVDVYVEKTDAETGESLGGARLAVYKGAISLGESLVGKEMIGSPWISVKNEEHKVEGLILGEMYTVVELQEPDNYLPAENVVFIALGSSHQKVVIKDPKNNKTVRINKVNSDTGQPVKGAKLALYKGSYEGSGLTAEMQDLTPVREWTSGSSYEIFTLDELRIGGTYTLVEKECPKKYFQADNVIFTVDNNSVQDIYMKDSPLNAEWRFNKKDAETGSRLAGAEFAIYKGSYPGRTTLPTVSVDTWNSSAAEDHILTDEEITIGEWYTFVELEPPEGYNLAEEPRQVFRAENKAVSTFTFYNDKSTDKPVYIWKVDHQGKPISGAQLAVYKGNHTSSAALPETPLDFWTSDQNKAHRMNLEKGETYTLVEVKAPSGYYAQNGVTRKTFTVSTGDSTETIYYRNDPLPKHVYIQKKAADTGNALPGAHLELYEGAYPGNPGDIPEGTDPVVSWTSSNSPYEVTEHVDLGGTYTVVEREAPHPYSQARNTVFVVNNEPVQQVEIIDPKDKKSIYIEKIDANTGRSVKNARLRLYSGEYPGSGDPSDFSDLPDSWMDEWITDGTEHELQNAVSPGLRYTLVEMEAPDKYELANRIVFEVDNSDHQVVTMEDEPVNKRLFIDKIDDKTEKQISGARLKLYLGNYSEGNAELLDSWVTNKNETHEYVDRSGRLVKGAICTLVEEEAPEGYITAEDIVFEIDGSLRQYIKMIDEPLVKTVYIEKVDSETGEFVEGAKLALYEGEDTQGTCLDQWTSGSKSPHKVAAEIVPGRQYTITELQAPAGYTKFDDRTFIADNNPVQTIRVQDQKIMKNLYIEKRDQKTEEFVANAELKLYRGSWPGQKAINESECIDTWTTGSSAREYTATAVENISQHQLKMDEYYTIIESRTPAGYETAARKVFKVESNTDPQTIIVYDKPEGKPKMVEIEKTDFNTGNRLSGATLRLYKGAYEDDDDLPDIYEDEWISSASSARTYYNTLTIGQKYTVVEMESPDGYQKASNVIFTVDDSSIQLVTVADLTDTAPPIVMIEKVDSETGERIKGAQLKLYAGSYSETDYPEDSDIPVGSMVARWTSKEDEMYIVTSPTVERNRTYTLVESKVPEGYQKAKRIIFTVDKQSVSQTITVSDPPEGTYSLTIRKTDTITPLKWASFEIRKDSPTGSVVGTRKTVSSDDGKLTLDSIRASQTNTPITYYIVETEAPAGYKKSGPYGFKVDKNAKFTDLYGNMNCLTNTENNTRIPLSSGYYDIVNIEPEAELHIVKTNENKTQYLAGAQFRLKGTLAKDNSQISPKYSSITGTDGKTDIAGIRPGSYILEETIFPKGYSPIVRRYKVTVNNDGLLTMRDMITDAVVTDMENGRFVIRNRQGNTKDIYLVKYGKNNKPLANVTFRFSGTTSTGDVIQPIEITSDESGRLDIMNVASGNYTLEEIELPPGYLEKRTWDITVKTEP